MSMDVKTTRRIDIASIRREQIVDAAVAVIAEQGLQNLSLSEIEKKVGMSRGQLTYYFKAKEEILLAVFDRLLVLMCRQHEEGAHEGEGQLFLERLEGVLRVLLAAPAVNPDFQALHFTFLAQIGHREDFRSRLANLYEEWRRQCAADVAAGQAADDFAPVNPRALATLVQAILHGLVIQAAVAPEAIDADEVIRLTVDVIGSYLQRKRNKHEGRSASGRTAVERGERS